MRLPPYHLATTTALLAGVLLAPAAPRPLAAQPHGVIAGTVIDDVRGEAVAGARVRLAGQSVESLTDSTGRFRFEALPLGVHRLRIEAPGYAVLDAEVEVIGTAGSDTVYRLAPAPVGVDGLEARAEPSARMLALEVRRRRSAGGRFLDRDDLASRETSTLADVLRTAMPGARLVRGSGGSEMHLASRAAVAPGALLAARPCYAQLYVDGVKIYGQTLGNAGSEAPPDLGAFPVRDLEAVEYYTSPSSTPVEFRTSTATCGTLVIWTRAR